MHINRAYGLVVAALVFGTLISACGAAREGVTVWIDAPLSGGQVHPGDEVPVQTHAYASSGVVQIELMVDGLSFSREAPSPAGGDLATLTQTWIATSPGRHTLQVVAFDSTGAVSNRAAVVIEVLGEAAAAPEVTTPGVVPPTFTPTPYIIPITITAAVPPVINFSVDDGSLSSGECTFLRWQAQNAISVTLDGSPVGNPDARQVCPQQTTNYVLRAASAGGEQSQSLQIQVSTAAPPPPPPPPQDTAGPVISNVDAQPATIFDNPSCGPDRAQVTASVTDAGSGVKRVDIYYKVVKQQAQSGQWVSQKMQAAGGSAYSFYLGSAELTLSLQLYGGGSVQYYLVAVDNAGNSSQSGTAAFQAQTCIF
jgi:hypothetical protein